MIRKVRMLSIVLNVFFLISTERSTFAAPGDIHTVAGIGVGDGLPATSAMLALPSGIAVDHQGNIFVADSNHNRIRRIDANTGIITTIAGNGYPAYSGDGPAVSANLNNPVSVAVDTSGNIYIADRNNNMIRKVDATTGIITTVAGNASWGYAGDDGPAVLASMSLGEAPGIAVDGAGNIYIADTYSSRVRRIDVATGIITTVAGNGSWGYAGDNGAATMASLSTPQGIAFDTDGNLYIADNGNATVRKVDAIAGIITTVAGVGYPGSSGDNGPAVSAELSGPMGITVDASGGLFIAESGSARIRKVDLVTGIITTVAGDGSPGYSGDEGPAIAAQLNFPFGVAVDVAGNLYISDSNNNRVRKVSAATGLIAAIAGNGTFGYSGDNGPAASAALNSPRGVVSDSEGNIYIADTYNHRMRKIDGRTGVITTLSGNGMSTYSGDNGPASAAGLSQPAGVVVDTLNNIYVADSGNNRIRKIDGSSGVITTVVGNGKHEYSGDNGPARAAGLACPNGLAIDTLGNIIIADTCNHRIRKVDVATNIITTVAGNGSWLFSGDGGPATSAGICSPANIAVNASGDLYIPDGCNRRIRKVVGSTGIITTVAGSGGYGNAGDNGPAVSAELAAPHGLSLDMAGNIFIGDIDRVTVRKVDNTTGIITTIAGGMEYGYSGDGGPAVSAAISRPFGVHVDPTGNVYIADTDNGRIRMIEGVDATPDAFMFGDVVDVAPLTAVISNSVTVRGINIAVPISMTGGEFEINGSGIWTSVTGTAVNGDSVRVRQTSSAQYSTATEAVLTIGGGMGAFRVTTRAYTPPPTVIITSPVSGITKDNRPLLAYTVSAGTVVVTVDSAVVAKVSGDRLDVLADGTHTVRVDVTDALGQSTSASITFTVDTAAPFVSITSPAAGLTNNKTPVLTYSVSEGVVVVKVDGAEVSKVSGNTLDALADGTHTVRVEATDAAGNMGVAEVSITVDTIPPAVSIDPVPSPVKEASVTVKGTREMGSMVTLSISPSAVVGPVSYVTDTTWTCTISGLKRKTSYSVTATARDAAGNTASAGTSFKTK